MDLTMGGRGVVVLGSVCFHSFLFLQNIWIIKKLRSGGFSGLFVWCGEKMKTGFLNHFGIDFLFYPLPYLSLFRGYNGVKELEIGWLFWGIYVVWGS